MKINLNKIEEDYNINVDDYVKFIITHRCFESIDECEPISYKKDGDKLYIPNNFILLLIHARPSQMVEQPPKIILAAYDEEGNTVTGKVCLKAFRDKYEVWRAIKNTLQDMDAKYTERVTKELIGEIILQLPCGITRNFFEKDSTEREFDRVDYNH